MTSSRINYLSESHLGSASSQWAKPTERAIYGSGAKELLEWIDGLSRDTPDKTED